MGQLPLSTSSSVFFPALPVKVRPKQPPRKGRSASNSGDGVILGDVSTIDEYVNVQYDQSNSGAEEAPEDEPKEESKEEPKDDPARSRVSDQALGTQDPPQDASKVEFLEAVADAPED
eukprot:c16563_g1_i1.p1 GENE.c16563_g1_i1~~c16563_g1_i1.p1  ORF type:complete len:118 (+),score=38.14 c16563_g1_i1:1-354(+)